MDAQVFTSFTLEHLPLRSVMDDAHSSREEGRWGVFPLNPGNKARTRMPARMVGFNAGSFSQSRLAGMPDPIGTVL